MPNICIDARYIFPQMDGIGRYLYNLIDNLSKVTEDRNDFHFIIIEVEKYADTSILRKLDNRKNLQFLRVKTLPQSLANNFIKIDSEKTRIDLYHYPQFDFPLFLPYRSVMTIHDMNPQNFPGFFSGFKGQLKRMYSIIWNYIGLIRSGKVITVSQNTADELAAFYGERFRSKICPILLAVESQFNDSVVKNIDEAFKDKLENLLHGAPYFLYVGNNRPHKNLKRLICAYHSARREVQNFPKLLLIGKFAPYSSYSIEKHIQELNLESEVVRVTASETDLVQYYKHALAFIFISLSEGFGFPVLEAMAAGAPVIASNTGAVKEVCSDAAYTINPESISEIKDALQLFFKSDDIRVEYIKKGRQRSQLFSWEKCASETLKVYKNVLNIE